MASGFTNEECIHLVYPEKENINEVVKTALHEIVHLLSYKLSVEGKRTILLEEGLSKSDDYRKISKVKIRLC